MEDANTMIENIKEDAKKYLNSVNNGIKDLSKAQISERINKLNEYKEFLDTNIKCLYEKIHESEDILMDISKKIYDLEYTKIQTYENAYLKIIDNDEILYMHCISSNISSEITEDLSYHYKICITGPSIICIKNGQNFSVHYIQKRIQNIYGDSNSINEQIQIITENEFQNILDSKIKQFINID